MAETPVRARDRGWRVWQRLQRFVARDGDRFYRRTAPEPLIGAIYQSSIGESDDWSVKARIDAQRQATVILNGLRPWLLRSVHETCGGRSRRMTLVLGVTHLRFCQVTT